MIPDKEFPEDCFSEEICYFKEESDADWTTPSDTAREWGSDSGEGPGPGREYT